MPPSSWFQQNHFGTFDAVGWGHPPHQFNPAFLMRLALDRAVGSTAAKAISDIFGTQATENERGWLTELRDGSDNTDPRLTTRSRSVLRDIFGK